MFENRADSVRAARGNTRVCENRANGALGVRDYSRVGDGILECARIAHVVCGFGERERRGIVECVWISQTVCGVCERILACARIKLIMGGVI